MLLGGDDVLEGHTGHEGSSQGVVDLVLEGGVEVTVLVHLELSAGLVVELVLHSESGGDDLGAPVEGELRADSLGVVGNVVHEEEELAELESLGVRRLVLEAEVGLVAETPVETEVVLVEVAGVGVNVELATDSEVRA